MTGFHAELSRRFGSHLGKTKAAGPRWSYPLSFHLSREYRAAALRAGGRLRPWHSSHRRAGPESGPEGCGGAGGSVAGCGAAGPRYRGAGYVETVRTLAAVRFVCVGGVDRWAEPAVLQRHRAAAAVCAIWGWASWTPSVPRAAFFMRHAGGDIGKAAQTDARRSRLTRSFALRVRRSSLMGFSPTSLLAPARQAKISASG
jgi:hypothetical protein